jgi:hypothetical protein
MREMVDLPAPDGDDTMNKMPRRSKRWCGAADSP